MNYDTMSDVKILIQTTTKVGRSTRAKKCFCVWCCQIVEQSTWQWMHVDCFFCFILLLLV